MDVAAFERVYESFREFHAFFAVAFGRKQWREHSKNYLQALLVQSQERRNAENLSEAVPASARAMQRFLTEARWDDNAVIGRLQEYLGPKLADSQAVWVFDGSDFPKQGVKSVGVARQYCGALGKIANCQAGVFLAHVGPGGRALADKRLYLPEEWTSDADRCAAARVPPDRREYRSEDGAGLGDAGAGTGARPPERPVGRRGFRLRDVSVFPGGSGGSRNVVRTGRAAGHDGLAAGACLEPAWSLPGAAWSLPGACLEPAWEQPGYQGFGRPRKPKLLREQRLTVEGRSLSLPEEAWREVTVAEGTQGPRTYMFSAQRVRVTRMRKPGEVVWAVYRRNLDGSEPRYYLSNAPEDTPLETLAYVGGSRWRIETEFETEKSDVGLDEYETRTWAGWNHHIALCLLGGAFLLSLQQEGGEKDAPDHPPAGVPGSA